MKLAKNSPDWEAGYEAAKVDFQDRFDFLNSPDRQCTIAKRLSVICPTCWAEPFHWCTYTVGRKRGKFTTMLHVARQAR